MAKLKIIIEIEIKADPNDDESIRESLYEKLTMQMEAEELDFRIDEDEDEETEEYD